MNGCFCAVAAVAGVVLLANGLSDGIEDDEDDDEDDDVGERESVLFERPQLRLLFVFMYFVLVFIKNKCNGYATASLSSLTRRQSRLEMD